MREATVKTFDVFGVNANILICITKCMDEEELRNRWREFRNELAGEYQTELIDDFERWNFYLFYVVEDKNTINRSLKHEIEHDTISSRKIIVSRNEVTDNEGKCLIVSYIKFDIEQTKEFVQPKKLLYNETAKKIVG